MSPYFFAKCKFGIKNSFSRRELQIRLEQLILIDPDLANKQNAEQMLWKSVFYHMVEMIRKQKDGDRDEESKVRLDRLLEEVPYEL